jgi:hypothetical protein
MARQQGVESLVLVIHLQLKKRAALLVRRGESAVSMQ